MEKTKTLDKSTKEQINRDLYPDSSITMCPNFNLCGEPLYVSKNRKDAYCMICDKKKLEDIEARFFSRMYLSDQQEEDITWLINKLKGIYSG